MLIRNVHERLLSLAPAQVGALIDSLASPDDGLWPRDRWPAMRLDRPLTVGAIGGHGPIRYTVDEYEPGLKIRFRFTGMAGFVGTHGFIAEPAASGGTRLRHELLMHTEGSARLTWPAVFRPLHDALIEDALDRAAVAAGQPPSAPAWSPWVRVLRRVLRRAARRHSVARPG
ncbi:MAG: SRPBCC family protein [Gemmatimonadota bacterium]|nr:SRPBCC family protein [Gemmatimonadota bacterium]